MKTHLRIESYSDIVLLLRDWMLSIPMEFARKLTPRVLTVPKVLQTWTENQFDTSAGNTSAYLPTPTSDHRGAVIRVRVIKGSGLVRVAVVGDIAFVDGALYFDVHGLTEFYCNGQQWAASADWSTAFGGDIEASSAPQEQTVIGLRGNPISADATTPTLNDVLNWGGASWNSTSHPKLDSVKLATEADYSDLSAGEIELRSGDSYGTRVLADSAGNRDIREGLRVATPGSSDAHPEYFVDCSAPWQYYDKTFRRVVKFTTAGTHYLGFEVGTVDGVDYLATARGHATLLVDVTVFCICTDPAGSHPAIDAGVFRRSASFKRDVVTGALSVVVAAAQDNSVGKTTWAEYPAVIFLTPSSSTHEIQISFTTSSTYDSYPVHYLVETRVRCFNHG